MAAGCDARQAGRLERLATASLLSAVAITLSYLEATLPLPVSLPGVKLGLANVAVAVALVAADGRTAAEVALVKVLASGLLFGSPVTLAYSLGGTACSLAGMCLLALVPGVGVVPVCMLGAVLHNAGQLAVAALMLGTRSVVALLPPLAAAALVTGSVTGAVAQATLASLAGVEREEKRPLVEGRLELVPGERVAFVGANGSGKTSYALALVRRLNETGGLGRAAMAFQDPDDQIVATVVRDDVAFGPENLGMPRERMAELVDEALSQVGLAAEMGGREVATLSGGERQRVAVAGLLALAPGVVVLDETTSMLDPDARRRVSGLVARLCAGGVAVVQVTQVMDEAFEADRVALFRDGAIAAVRTPAELLGEEGLFASLGLELPRAARLARELAEAGLDVPLTASVDELAEALIC